MPARSASLLFTSALLVLAACGGGERTPHRDSGPPPPDGGGPTSCSPGGPAVVCNGSQATTCNPDGSEAGITNCAELGQTCAAGLGCRACQPGRGSCDDAGNTLVCMTDGSGFMVTGSCDASAGESCNPSTGLCASLCNDAISSNSYIGCEYYPTVTANSGLAAEFEFAVVVSNPQTVPAQITITRGGSAVSTTTVPGGGVETIKLPWVNELKGTFDEERSALVRGGAYRLVSTAPVTVYQFNPLDYEIPRDCVDEPSLFPDGVCNSFSNDASLLLPAHVLTQNYIAMSWPSMMLTLTDPLFGDMAELRSPGYVTIVGVDASPVTVTVNLAGNVQASSDGAVGPLTAGSSGMWTLNQGDVLQLVGQSPPSCSPGRSEARPGDGAQITYCRVTEQYDLSGTVISATGKIAVIGGHNCTFVPYDRWACDHLEEMMFPLDTWGKDFVVSATQPLRGEPNLIRIMSGADGNSLTFDPNVTSNTTLNRGEILEFETSQDFRVVGSEALLVAQFLVGQDYGGIGASGEGGNGDPALSLAVPTEQFRTQYSFLAPPSYEISYVNVTAASGTNVVLDGTPVGGWTPVGGTGMQTTRVMVSGGSHEITSDLPFGIVVYGFGSYTSYMYPGGLDFEVINPLI